MEQESQHCFVLSAHYLNQLMVELLLTEQIKRRVYENRPVSRGQATSRQFQQWDEKALNDRTVNAL